MAAQFQRPALTRQSPADPGQSSFHRRPMPRPLDLDALGEVDIVLQH
jgi:hypothetical protein